MNSKSRQHKWFVTLLLFAGPCLCAQDDQQTLRSFFEKAKDLSDIKAEGMPGFVLKAEVRIWVKKDTATDGKYLLVWTSEGKWREEVTFPGYTRTRIGDRTQLWQVRSPADENPAINELDQLLASNRAAIPSDTDKLTVVAHNPDLGANVECVKRSPHPRIGWTYCFDSSTGDLLEISTGNSSPDIPWKVNRQVHSKFKEWSAKRVPLILLGYNGKQAVLEVNFEEIKPPPVLPSNFFTPPTEVTSWAYCGHNAIWTLKERVQPQYPPSARMQHRQGTVLLYAVIGEDGKLSGLKIVHSAGQELDQSAMFAVSRWRYERTAACSESKGRTETFIDVAYTLNE